MKHATPKHSTGAVSSPIIKPQHATPSNQFIWGALYREAASEIARLRAENALAAEPQG